MLGGATVLCESIPLLPDIAGSSDRLVDAMDIDGISMVEFRRDRDGRPRLMEVNARMGSSVALAVRAGVDFPSLLHAWAMGGVVPEVGDYRIGERLRWLVGDMWFVNTAFGKAAGTGRPVAVERSEDGSGGLRRPPEPARPFVDDRPPARAGRGESHRSCSRVAQSSSSVSK